MNYPDIHLYRIYELCFHAFPSWPCLQWLIMHFLGLISFSSFTSNLFFIFTSELGISLIFTLYVISPDPFLFKFDIFHFIVLPSTTPRPASNTSVYVGTWVESSNSPVCESVKCNIQLYM